MTGCRLRKKPFGSDRRRKVGVPTQARICSAATEGGVAESRQILGFVTTLKNS